MLGKYIGTVRWFGEAKGYGFLAPSAGGEDVFVHFSGIVGHGPGRRNLVQGDEVSYNMEISKQTGKPHAVDVEVVASADKDVKVKACNINGKEFDDIVFEPERPNQVLAVLGLIHQQLRSGAEVIHVYIEQEKVEAA